MIIHVRLLQVNTLTCPKKALITPINEHWVSETTEHTQLDWIKSKLK